jgi:hypothetical protein
MNPLVENQIKVTSAIELVDASPGDILTVRIGRVGNDPLDTAIAYVYAKGAILSYTADS